MTDKRKPIVFPFEPDMDREAFERSPILIIAKFLEAFDSEGRQALQIPQHVLEAMAVRFREVVGPDHRLNSLDAAFGGRIARQRNRLLQEERQFDVSFAVHSNSAEAKALPRVQRGRSTPFEIGISAAAEDEGISEENARRIYKEAAKH